MSWMVWEEQTCDQIDRLYRAIGSQVMMTDMDDSVGVWMEESVWYEKLLLYMPSDTSEDYMDGQDNKTSRFCRKMSHFIIRYV